MSGTLLISENMNALTEFAVFDGEKYVALDLISSRINFAIQVSPDTFVDLQQLIHSPLLYKVH